MDVKNGIVNLTWNKNSPSITYPTTGPGWLCGGDPSSDGEKVKTMEVATTLGDGASSGCDKTTLRSRSQSDEPTTANVTINPNTKFLSNCWDILEVKICVATKRTNVWMLYSYNPI